MKFYSFVLFVLLISYSNSFAQINNRFNHDRYSKQTQNQPNKSEVLESALEYLKTTLKLDGFQEAIVKNLIKENDEKASQILNNPNLEKKAKTDAIEQLSNSFKNEVLAILNEEQKKIYEGISSNNKKKNKKK
jgi:hypothetical protein